MFLCSWGVLLARRSVLRKALKVARCTLILKRLSPQTPPLPTLQNWPMKMGRTRLLASSQSNHPPLLCKRHPHPPVWAKHWVISSNTSSVKKINRFLVPSGSLSVMRKARVMRRWYQSWSLSCGRKRWSWRTFVWRRSTPHTSWSSYERPWTACRLRSTNALWNTCSQVDS